MKTERTKEAFKAWWEQGVPVAEIVKGLRISRRTACYWRKKLGLAGRKKPRP